MIRALLVCFLIQVILCSSTAQQPTQTIRGSVFDISSNVPLPYANITLINTNLGTVTDSSGNFSLINVNTGRYDIQVSMMGYETLVMKEVLLSSGKEVFLNIALKENIISLPQVSVRPKVNKQLPLNNRASVSAKMLSVEEAQRYAGGFDDPARLVSSFAGVSSSVNNNAIMVRGNSPQSLQWKLEGVEIPNPNHFADLHGFGGGVLTALSSQLLANSDFFSGAMPAEYNNALSGVFDIYMRNGNNQKREHTFQAGILGIDMASEGPFKKDHRSSYLFNYRYSTLTLVQSLFDEQSISYQDLSFKLNFPTKRAGVFTIWGIGLMDGSKMDVKTDTSEWKYDEDKEAKDIKQYMGATGISHKIICNKKQYINTTLAATIHNTELSKSRIINGSELWPVNEISSSNSNYVLSSFINTKFNSKHINKTGIVLTGLKYDMQFDNAEPADSALQTIVTGQGLTTLLSAYSNYTLNFSDKLTMNAGLCGQLFLLNKHYAIEPRFGIKYQFATAQALSFGYGLHSRLERINYFFVENDMFGEGYINKDMDFTKAHHFVLGYDIDLSEFIHLKVETYYQYLFNVPVIANSSFSIINQQDDWFFDGKLVNTGTGENYGMDIFLEKYLSNGYYYIFSSSLFNSKYKGGDDILRNTRYNRNFTCNFLIGKEWQLGNNKQNVLSLNVQFSYQGGERYSPIDAIASETAQDVIFDETCAFSKQLSPAFISHFTAGYKINKKNSTHEIALKILNFTNYQEFMGFEFNYKTLQVDELRLSPFMPNLSYKIDF